MPAQSHILATMLAPMLAPVVALVAWSLVMWLWLYATRLPAMRRARIELDPELPPGELTRKLPASVRWKADNYNHLMEQPTLFYALALTLALLGEGQGVNLWLAWGYVGLRVAHSLVQALFNKIEVRFALFFVASLMLVVMTYNAIMALA